jgi:hypothetical protein
MILCKENYELSTNGDIIISLDTFTGFIRCHNLKLSKERIYISRLNWKCDCDTIKTTDKIEIVVSNNINSKIVICIIYPTANNIDDYLEDQLNNSQDDKIVSGIVRIFNSEIKIIQEVVSIIPYRTFLYHSIYGELVLIQLDNGLKFYHISTEIIDANIINISNKIFDETNIFTNHLELFQFNCNYTKFIDDDNIIQKSFFNSDIFSKELLLHFYPKLYTNMVIRDSELYVVHGCNNGVCSIVVLALSIAYSGNM